MVEFLDLAGEDRGAYFSSLSFMCPRVSCYFDGEHLPAAGGMLTARALAGERSCPVPTGTPSVFQNLFFEHRLHAYEIPKSCKIKNHSLILKEKKMREHIKDISLDQEKYKRMFTVESYFEMHLVYHYSVKATNIQFTGNLVFRKILTIVWILS